MKRNKEAQKMLTEVINQREELIGILKAIINKFNTQEIMVSRQEINNASKYEIFIKNNLLENAKTYQLIDNEKILESYKGDK